MFLGNCKKVAPDAAWLHPKSSPFDSNATKGKEKQAKQDLFLSSHRSSLGALVCSCFFVSVNFLSLFLLLILTILLLFVLLILFMDLMAIIGRLILDDITTGAYGAYAVVVVVFFFLSMD